MTQKALLQSAGDGTAVPAGYVGQIISSQSTSLINLSSNTWIQLSSLTLNSGLWIISYSSAYNKNGSTYSTDTNIALAVGSSVADINANYTTKYRMRTASQLNFNTVVSLTEMCVCSGQIYIRSDGTNLYFSDGTQLTSSSQNLILAAYTGIYSGNIPNMGGFRFEAIRIA